MAGGDATAPRPRTRAGDGLEGLLAGLPVTHVRWGLERTEGILAALNHPERSFRSLHVAGTNGKGSAAATAYAVLRAHGFRSGLNTSPHLLSPYERIRAPDLPRELVDRCADRVRPLVESHRATYFEAVTAVAFLCFAEFGAEWVVVEVGLGGRLDATNVLRPEICTIVTIERDHESMLGRSLVAIAREKAGILKRGIPVCIGRLRPAAERAIRARARGLGAPVRRLGTHATVEEVKVCATGTNLWYRGPGLEDGIGVRTPLAGVHQADNVALALMAVGEALPELDPDAVRRGVAATRLPGRFQRVRSARGDWFLDLAHNPAAAAALLATVDAVTVPPRAFVVSVLRDKKWREMLRLVFSRREAVVLTDVPSAPEERRWDLAEAGRFAERCGARAEVERDFERALLRARELSPGGAVVVTGSTYTVAAALKRIRS